jgi:hypothetical protein
MQTCSFFHSTFECNSFATGFDVQLIEQNLRVSRLFFCFRLSVGSFEDVE